ncbi:hypothetical protein M758_6G149200 [Ceratodon purpureus]|nr:hypothetical protein M758_6G149200 [Ceratodon purpureus]
MADATTYTVHVRVIQTEPSSWFSVVEKTVWKYANGGTWSNCNGEHTLTMGGSGTSGALRLKNPQGEYFLVVLGIHNYVRWCDIVPDLTSSETGVDTHPKYYATPVNQKSHDMLGKQLANLEVTSAKGARIAVNYYKEEESTKWATITIDV